MQYDVIYKSADGLSTRTHQLLTDDIDDAAITATDLCDGDEFVAAVVQCDVRYDVRLALASLDVSDDEYSATVSRDPETVWWARAYRNGVYQTGFSGATRDQALEKARGWASLDRAARRETPEPERVAL